MNKKENSIGLNYIFCTLYQILTMITPLITTPYVSRVLTAEGVGIVSYTHAIVDYVIVLATFGTSIYANRKIAFLQGSRKEQSQLFGEVLFIRAITLTVGIGIYFLIIYLGKANSIMMFVQGIYLIAEFFNIDWVFTGNEDFKVTVARSFVIKVLGIIAIFLFVKEAQDVYLYAGLLGGSILLGNLSLWYYLPRYIEKVKLQFSRCREHVIGSIKLFMPQLAGTIYAYFDKIMLGLLTVTSVENGYYEQTQKVIRLSITILSTLPTVMLPRMANVYAKNEEEKLKSYLNLSLQFVIVIGVPLMFGIMAVSDGIVGWFFGEGYDAVGLLLKVLAPVVIFNAIYNVIGYQYFLATKRETSYTYIILVGAITNIVFNVILIPTFGALGAIIGSLMAEAIVAVIMLVFIRKVLEKNILGITLLKTMIPGAIMGILARKMNLIIGYGILQTFVIILMSVPVYFFMELLVKESLVMRILSRLKRSKG